MTPMSKYDTLGSRSTLLFTFQNLPPVYDTIFQHLSPLNLIRVARTCKDARKALQSYKRRAFSINRLLSQFFKDPLAFRSLQARTGTLISGSQALQFFGRRIWTGSDLDIYTCPGRSLEVGKWLQGEGYRFVPNSYQPTSYTIAAGPLDEDDIRMTTVRDWDPRNPIDMTHEQIYAITGISAVFSFEKQVGNGVLKVQIVAASYSPLEVLLHFHSTAVMNFIAWDKAYSIYPYATFEKSRSLICFIPKMPCPRYDKAMVKYRERGFTMIADLYPHEDPRCAFRLGTRFVGDEHSFIMSLNTDGVEPISIPDESSGGFDQYLLNGWDVKKTPTSTLFQGEDTKFEMDTRIVWSSILRHTYTAPYEFAQYACSFFIEQGKVEHAKLSESEALTYAGRRNPKPSFWKFYDEELAIILQKWIQTRKASPETPSSLS